MPDQGGFNFDPPPPPPSQVERWRLAHDDGTYPRDFWEWLEENQHILWHFIAVALEWLDSGGKHWSARAVVHIMRWQTAIRERHQTNLKINNNCTPGLARLAAKVEPRLDGFFETRTPPGTDKARRLKDGKLYGESEED